MDTRDQQEIEEGKLRRIVLIIISVLAAGSIWYEMPWVAAVSVACVTAIVLHGD